MILVEYQYGKEMKKRQAEVVPALIVTQELLTLQSVTPHSARALCAIALVLRHHHAKNTSAT